MAEVIWTASALEDLERIADYIAVTNPDAASDLVRRALAHAGQLANHPQSGPIIPEMRGTTERYRQLVEPPCRIFYRVEGNRAIILHVIRGEMKFSAGRLRKRSREGRRSTAS